jgi:exoribonuclease-2
VEISVRQRGAPLDLIVAEAMILANSTWGNWLAEHGVPGIYRSQASLAPGVKVRMGTKALPHAGIGVKSYAWSTSPLRRYTDMVNQWQIIAVARHGKTAALAAPFKPKDAELFSIISGFDAAYSAYNGYQAGMERFWTLKYLQQQGITELTRPSSRTTCLAARAGARRRPAAGVAGAGRAGPGARRARAREAGRGLTRSRWTWAARHRAAGRTGAGCGAPRRRQEAKTNPWPARSRLRWT